MLAESALLEGQEKLPQGVKDYVADSTSPDFFSGQGSSRMDSLRRVTSEEDHCAVGLQQSVNQFLGS